MIYLDNGATSFPKPLEVTRAMEMCMHRFSANAGRGSHRLSLWAAEKTWETRESLAKLFGIKKPERIAFTLNCTDSINSGLFGVLGDEDAVVISDMEHNSVYRPAMKLLKHGHAVAFAESDAAGMISKEAVLRVLSPKTRIICLQHASNVGGGINPIMEIGRMARERGILFMVDAAQTAGSVPIDVERDYIDILAFPGHKGLLGPQGTGGLYVREGISIRPIRHGGTGSASESAEMPDFFPDRLEAGTQNLPGIVGLGEGVRFIQRLGVLRIQKHERRLISRLMQNMEAMDGVRVLGPRAPEMRAGVLSVHIEGRDAAFVATELDRKYQIAVRAGLHCSPLAAKRFQTMESGSLRFSPGVFNSLQDIEYAAYALREILRSEKRKGL